jgi:hypothetical protein
VATLPRKKIFFFFSKAPCIIRTTNFFGKSSRLMSRQVEDHQQLLGWYVQWSKTLEAEASLVERRSSACCFIIHGAWGLAVGDIPPDTLMAIHGPDHPRCPGPQYQGVQRKATRCNRHCNSTKLDTLLVTLLLQSI